MDNEIMKACTQSYMGTVVCLNEKKENIFLLANAD